MPLRRWSPPLSSSSRLRAAVAVRSAFGPPPAPPCAPTSREVLDMAREEHLRRVAREEAKGEDASESPLSVHSHPSSWIASWPEDMPPREVLREQAELAARVGGAAGAAHPMFCKSAVIEAGGAGEHEGAQTGGGGEPCLGSCVRVEPNLRVSACALQHTPWGVIRAQGLAARSRFPVLVNADVFVFDTGVQRRHPDLRVASAVSVVAHERTPEDLNGHGTAVAGVIAALDNRRDVVGVAPGARIHSVKVLDRTGSGYLSDILTGIEYMILWKRRFRRGSNAVVANFSLAAYTGSEAYTALDFAIRRASAEGITCVAAAGNEGEDARLLTPAHCREAITVGAFDASNRFASFSNHGPAVDLLAPGVAVRTTYLGSSLASISGTSFAAPHVAGAALVHLLRRRGRRSPAQVASQLRWGARQRDARNPKVRDVPAGTTSLSLNARLV
jgi:hypothetical protein